eukprot:3228576-Prymnesium_polylepis.1
MRPGGGTGRAEGSVCERRHAHTGCSHGHASQPLLQPPCSKQPQRSPGRGSVPPTGRNLRS